MEKTSLKKSHSKVSNFKLTLECLLGLIGFSGVWASIILKSKIDDKYFYMGLIIASILLLLSILMLRRFKR